MEIIDIPANENNYVKGRTQAVREIILHVSQCTIDFLNGYFSRPNERGVSSHYGIAQDGRVFRYVQNNDTAQHARQANPFSIGIEHEGIGTTYSAPDAQLRASAELCAALCTHYNLDPLKAIKKHSDYVATACPVNLQVDRIIQGAKQIIDSQTIAEPERWVKLYQGGKFIAKVPVTEGLDIATKVDASGSLFVDVR